MKYLTGVVLILMASACQAGDDEEAIARLLGKTFDKPGASVVSAPIVVEGEHAIADWVQGHHGGRALLVRRDRQWSVVMCGGRGLASMETLTSADVPAAQAAALSGKLAEAEAGLSREQVHLFDSFQGQLAH